VARVDEGADALEIALDGRARRKKVRATVDGVRG
jgi:hypothetical protein